MQIDCSALGCVPVVFFFIVALIIASRASKKMKNAGRASMAGMRRGQPPTASKAPMAHAANRPHTPVQKVSPAGAGLKKVEATVIGADVGLGKGASSTRYRPSVRFTYELNGRIFQSNLGVEGSDTDDFAEAMREVERLDGRFTPGTQMTAWVMEQMPEKGRVAGRRSWGGCLIALVILGAAILLVIRYAN